MFALLWQLALPVRAVLYLIENAAPARPEVAR